MLKLIHKSVQPNFQEDVIFPIYRDADIGFDDELIQHSMAALDEPECDADCESDSELIEWHKDRCY